MPELKRNLIFLRTLDELGFSYKAEHGNINIYKNNELILTRTKTNGLYVLNGGYYFVVQLKTNETYLWHLKLGHVS